MASGRSQRRVERLLDEADEARRWGQGSLPIMPRSGGHDGQREAGLKGLAGTHRVFEVEWDEKA